MGSHLEFNINVTSGPASDTGQTLPFEAENLTVFGPRRNGDVETFAVLQSDFSHSAVHSFQEVNFKSGPHIGTTHLGRLRGTKATAEQIAENIHSLELMREATRIVVAGAR